VAVAMRPSSRSPRSSFCLAGPPRLAPADADRRCRRPPHDRDRP
jgi:hypothetical protein